jgi:hypothetical protein
MPAGWRVITPKHTEKLMPNGQFQDVVELMIQADDGVYTTLTIPDAQYTADVVLALGDAWLERHMSVMRLNNL